MLDNLLRQPLVDRPGHRHAARLLQGLGQRLLEKFPLFRGGHGGLRVEHGVNELLMQFLRLAGVKQGVINIGGTPVKGREQESQFRLGHHLPGGIVELVIPGEVA